MLRRFAQKSKGKVGGTLPAESHVLALFPSNILRLIYNNDSLSNNVLQLGIVNVYKKSIRSLMRQSPNLRKQTTGV